MSFTLEVPPEYGYVILACGIGPALASMYMGSKVMGARERLKVPYPNLYATPGFHKDADEFNRIQRGHQNLFEFLPTFTVTSMLGGLKHPIACAVSGVLFSVGYILFMVGYSDTKLDVKMARYKKGGMIKWIGYFGAIGSCISLAGSMLGWWQ